MILSAGLSPAWQQILVFDHFRCGEVNRAREAHWCSSGKVLNAGIAAHRLGGPSLTLATVGGPPLAQIEAEFHELGVPHRWVVTESATRVCTTILDRATGQMTELVENGRRVTDQEVVHFVQDYAEEVGRAAAVVLTGSLPAGAPPTLYRELLARTQCPAVLDFRGEALLSALDGKPYVVKPNREELGLTLGRSLDTDEDLLGAMHELNRRGAQWVVVTQGAGPVWVTSMEKVLRFIPPAVPTIVNPIGCGDALAAGIAWATRQGKEIDAAVEIGMAVSAENLSQLLPCRPSPARQRAV